MAAFVCSAGATGFGALFSSFVMPLVLYASIAASMIVAGTLMVGKALQNDKLVIWAQGEIIQVVISVLSASLVVMLMGSFCSIKIGEIGNAVGINGAGVPPAAGTLGIYEAAEAYLTGATRHTQEALLVVRYHYEAYSVLAALSAFLCEPQLVGCLFGYSGVSAQPLGGFGAQIATLGASLNSTLITFFTVANALLVLIFVEKGFALLFLPLGIVLRSIPYMRTFGSLMVALAISFMIMYPLMLASFYLMEGVLFSSTGLGGVVSPNPATYREAVFAENSGGLAMTGTEAGGGLAAILGDALNYYRGQYFHTPGSLLSGGSSLPEDNVPGAILLASSALIAGVFLPMMALLATIASVGYIARFFGEDMDLSRLTQVV